MSFSDFLLFNTSSLISATVSSKKFLATRTRQSSILGYVP